MLEFVCLPWSEVCSARVTSLLLLLLLLYVVCTHMAHGAEHKGEELHVALREHNGPRGRIRVALGRKRANPTPQPHPSHLHPSHTPRIIKPYTPATQQTLHPSHTPHISQAAGVSVRMVADSPHFMLQVVLQLLANGLQVTWQQAARHTGTQQ